MLKLFWRWVDAQAKQEIVRLKEQIRELESMLGEEADGSTMAMDKLIRTAEELVQTQQYAELLEKQIKTQRKVIGDLTKRMINESK